MLTNLIQLLHTTAAYQAAAFQLMVAQASFTAQKLGLREPMPLMVEASTNAKTISLPMMGVGGVVMTSNYAYKFRHGHLVFIKRRHSDGTSRSPEDEPTTSMDTNSLLRLAENDLAILGVDVPAMERRFQPHVSRITVPAKIAAQDGKMPTEAERPIKFRLMWHAGSFNGVAPIQMEFAGKELVRCYIKDRSVFTNAPLQLNNAAALLGTTPTAAEFIKTFLGGESAYDTIASPDTTEAWLLNASENESGHIENLQHEGLIKLKPSAAKQFSKVLLDFDTYEWGTSKMCGPEYRLGLRFTRGTDVVEALFCFNCNILRVKHNDWEKDENFDFGHNQLVKLAQDIFSDEPTIRDLKVVDEKEEREEFENTIKSYEQN